MQKPVSFLSKNSSDNFYVVRARREQCGAAQGGHAVRAGAETTCLIYTYQGQLKEFAFSCLPCFCHKLLANINGVTRSSLSRLLRKPLENQRGTNMLLDRCQQVTNRITTKWEKHTNTQCAPWLDFNRAVSMQAASEKSWNNFACTEH